MDTPAQPTAGDGVEIAPGVRVQPGVLAFSFASSSGPGGQNVNKRATRAQLRLRLADIPIALRARERLARLGSHWIVGDAELLIECDEHRSQARNREGCLERLRALIIEARVPPKPRVATRPSRGSVQRRLDAKKRRAHTKRTRRDLD